MLYPNAQARADELAAANPTYQYRDFGVNILTQDLHVIPGYYGNFVTSLNYMSDHWTAGVGYAMHARRAEHVKLKNDWVQGPMLAALPSSGLINIAHGIGTAFSQAPGISWAANDDADVFIQAADLDLDSAAMPAQIAQQLFGTVGYYYACEHARIFKERTFELGGGYEWGHQDTVMHRWMLWGKFMFTF